MITSEWPTEEHPEWVPFLVDQVNSLKDAGVDVRVFHFRGAKNPIRYLSSWVKLRKQFQISEFQLVHAQFGQSGLMALPKEIPLVVTFHGSDVQGYFNARGRFSLSGKILAIVSRYVAKMADEIILVAGHLKLELNSKRDVHIIPCGVNLNKFSPSSQSSARQSLNIPESGKIVLFVADPQNPIKRFELAKAVVARVQKEIENVSLLVVSGVDHDTIPDYLNAGDVLLLTSKHEGSPTIVKEAKACNLPVVSVDVGDVRQQLKNIEGCYICDQDSPEEIASAVCKVLRNDQPILSRDSVRDLDEQVIAQKILNVYDLALIN